jgi:molybdopterin-guanine dinucleotide biosynthesis protein A
MTAVPAPREAVVLVGRATRLPAKFDRVLDGRTVLEHVLARVTEAGFEPTVVAVPESGRAGPGVLLDRYGGGPLGGVRTFLEHRAVPFVLVGGDMPFVSVRDLRRLRDLHGPGISVVPLRGDGVLEVLCAVYDVPLALVARYWAEGRALRDLALDGAAGGTVRFVPADEFDPASFVDLDTPEDWSRWGARSASSRGPGHE